MEYENIRKIWSGHIQSRKCTTEFRYAISKEDMKRFEKELGKEKCMDIEDVAMSLACEAEECGFIQGFKMATQLMSECFQGKGGTAV